MGEEEASEVEELGAVDELLDGGGLEVGGLEVLSGSKGGAERPRRRSRCGGLALVLCGNQETRDSPVVASNDDSARAGGLVLDDLVRAEEAFLLVGSGELLGEVVGTDSAEVAGRARREDVLHTLASARGLCRARARGSRLAWAARAAF